ncbi:MAG: Clp protease ClpP [Alphaproteobacteria bacterium]|nr:MAG: Clp protease ClpP [Alphaproteobacteria bacterium]
MSRRSLPSFQAFERPKGYSWDVPTHVLSRWQPCAAAPDDGGISIYDVIGQDPWTGEGFTAKRCAAALRAIGDRPVTVRINSFGGDFFEGVAIYNLLREHPSDITVRVMGLAASAASVIAMAGDRIEIGQGAFIMIHNAWSLAIGNRHDMRDLAATLELFDKSMAEVYAARTGDDLTNITAMMDAETWLTTSDAVAKGFADDVIESQASVDARASARADLAARHKIDLILAQAGLPRSQRRQLMRDANSGMPGAADPAMPCAGNALADAITQAISTLRSKESLYV